VQAGDDWVLDGRLPVVYHAPAADMLLVAASTGVNAASTDALFAVPVGSPGVRMAAFRTVDDQCAAELVFDTVLVPKDGCLARDATEGLSAVVDFGLVGLLGEALGALDRTLALTVEYTRTRSQFGGPIARFQALQHRMVDMLMHIEQARSLVYLAASRCDSGGAEAREAALSAAKVLVAAAARFVGQQAVQLHGGMGVSDEMPISHYFRRLLAVELRFGSASAHLGRYAAGMSLS
jgi:alkylation response protein AidB-like acyl-CoA dehydrogenase